MLKIQAFLLAFLAFNAVQAMFTKINKPRPHVKPSKLTSEPLILTDYLLQNRIDEARQVSEVHYDGFLNITSYSGYFRVDDTYDSNLFWWFFPAEKDYDNAPVVLWLQGGPGSPSLFGLFTEHGPFFVNEDLSVGLREYSWHKDHSVLYIDSPAGTGFSYTTGGFAQNQTKVGADLYTALIQFFTLFPELQSKPFFVSGESYGGKYVPAISYTIHKNNPSADLKINLQGILIGNGWSDPEHMFVFSDFLYELGLVDSSVRDEIKLVEAEAVQLIQEGNFTAGTQKFQDIILGDDETIFRRATGLTNIYNFLAFDDDDPDYWQDFIELDAIREALHVGATGFGVQADVVYDNLWDDMSKSVAPWIAELLDYYRVIIFNGQLDVVVGYVLTENYLSVLDFTGAGEYRNADRRIWYVNNRVAGYVKKAGLLTEVLVRDASHMVPTDQPEAAYDLLYKFVRDINLTN